MTPTPDHTDGPTQAVNRPSAGVGLATPPPVVAGDTVDRGRWADTDSPDTHALGAVPIVSDRYPRPGQGFAGFEVLSELGRGGMGRVFLAAQPAMASRLVVLKVGEFLSGECQKLARLQHPNVVPVHSFHQHGKLQAVCMPYRGPLTLGHLVSRLRDADLPTLSGRALTTVIDDCRKSRAKAIPAVHPPADPDPVQPPVDANAGRLFTRLRGLSYVDAILAIARQVAEGLRFAHGERIVHSDLKPANVLIADDGTPQLIDFGIAYDRSSPDARGLVIGGTRPYSSPEQLGSLLHTAVEHDERTDLYSLGVMLYEMTTGRLPYAADFDPSEEAIERDRAGRFTPPPSPRAVNPQVPAAVASIIAKCLAPDPADRYQTAADLIDDLDRQLARRPLLHAPNPSRRELAVKWTVRNRWFVAAGVVLAAGGAGFGAFGVHSERQKERLAVAEAVGQADRFDLDVKRARAALAAGATDAAGLDAAVRSAEKALAAYRVLDTERWWATEPATRLAPNQAVELRERVAALLLDLSRAGGTRAALATGGDRSQWLERANDWNRRAEQAFPAEAPRGVWTQRAWLARLAGDAAGADAAARTAAGIPLRTAVDFRTEGRELMEHGKLKDASERLAKAVELDPTDFWATFNLGMSHYARREDQAAVAAYDKCVSLDPAVPGAYYNRGMALLRLQQFQKAEDDFTRVIAAKAEWAEPYLNRAAAREALGQFDPATEDLSRALDLGYPPTAVLLTRSRVYARAGKADLARLDHAEGMKGTPTDDRGWITRGIAHMPNDPKAKLDEYQAALADFDKALALNPRSASALQFKARVYSRANENRRAVDVLTELLGYYPEALDALSGRAMLYSRMGERAKAHVDADVALRLADEAPRTVYQLAGVYAMTSATHPDDKREAFRLLASALRKGFGFDLLDQDRELDPLRSDPEFSEVIESARRVVELRTKE
jgi:serine/threonine protein kinase/Tfp pilus assembly protein PilF